MSGERQDVEPGVLYVVATPLGHLRDITLRALEVLQKVDILACEDTRTTLKLLTHYQIKGPRLLAFHEHNEKKRTLELLSALKAGKNVALLSEAGTPGLCDPGAYLVKQAHEAGVPVRPVPGPCALVAALSCSGVGLDQGFLFLGFMPSKKGERRAVLESLLSERRPVVFYESPHRIQETLADLLEVLGERKIFVAREMTKRHEEYFWTEVPRLLQRFQKEAPRGEFTLILEGVKGKGPASLDEATLRRELKKLLQEGFSVNKASQELSRRYGLSKKILYRLALELKKDDRPSG